MELVEAQNVCRILVKCNFIGLVLLMHLIIWLNKTTKRETPALQINDLVTEKCYDKQFLELGDNTELYRLLCLFLWISCSPISCMMSILLWKINVLLRSYNSTKKLWALVKKKPVNFTKMGCSIFKFLHYSFYMLVWWLHFVSGLRNSLFYVPNVNIFSNGYNLVNIK